jgi:YVTN family beta-propeller protein
MRGKRLAYIVLPALLVLLGGTSWSGRPAAVLQDEGAVFVYFEPLASDASRLDFRFEGLLAVREDGTQISVDLSIEDAREGAASGQRLLATGDLPPGQYKGLAVRVADATLEGEEGPVGLAPPSGPAEIDAPFRIRKRQAEVLELRFHFRDSIDEEGAFTPVFSAHPAQRPAVGRLGLASNRESNSITIFDKVSAKVVGVVPTGLAPAGIALDQGRKRAYVAISGEDTLIAIGLQEYSIIDRTTLRGGDVPVDLALTPDGDTLLSANLGSNTVSLIDTRSLTEVDRIQVGNEPRSVLVDSKGERAYVLNSASSSISVIDLRNRRLAGTISTEAEPLRAQFNQAGDKLYVIHRLSSRVSVVDAVNLRVTEKVYVGPGVTAITVDPRSDFVYLSRSGSGAVEIFDPIAFLPVDSFPVEGDVSYMALDVEQNYLYVLLPELRKVQVVEIVGNKFRGRVETGQGPYWVVVNGEK